jgi:hypothetical protein
MSFASAPPYLLGAIRAAQEAMPTEGMRLLVRELEEIAPRTDAQREAIQTMIRRANHNAYVPSKHAPVCDMDKDALRAELPDIRLQVCHGRYHE